MLEKEAKKEVMLYLYQKMKEEGKNTCMLSDIVAAIPESDINQVIRIIRGLKDSGFLSVSMRRVIKFKHIVKLGEIFQRFPLIPFICYVMID